MFRFYRFLMVFAVIVVFTGSVHAQIPETEPYRQAFIEPLGDVPLMDGLSVDYQSALIFDKPEGRFVEIAAYPAGISTSKIEAYYRQSLAALGWVESEKNKYNRLQENLEISFIQGDGGKILRFVLSPEKK